MKNYTVLKTQTAYHTTFVTYMTILALMFTIVLPQPSHAGPLTPPAVPANLKAPAGHKLFLVGHAVGTQQYMCLFPGMSAPWAFFGPQATLFKDNGKQILTHFLSPNPDENETPRATWQDSKDTSTVWAMAIASSSDPAFVTPGAIPWLLLDVVGAQDGPTGGDKLTATTFIQRLNTSGGIVPSSGCATASDIGKKALVPYTADYFFYEFTGSE
jgi:hypothetical protein